MTTAQIKKLVELTFINGDVNSHAAQYALSELSKADLKKYLALLKTAVAKNKVTIKVADDMDQNFYKELEKLFSNKKITIEKDPTLGAGIYIQVSDNIIDLTMKNYINSTVNSLKNEV